MVLGWLCHLTEPPHLRQGRKALAIMEGWQAHCEQLKKENDNLLAINERLLGELGKALAHNEKVR